MKFGLLPEPILDPRDHFEGVSDVAEVVTNDPLNFWEQFKPTKEYQNSPTGDTYSCVTFSCLNAYEYYFNYLMSKDPEVRTILNNLGCIDENGSANFSERFTAQDSGTDPNGGNSVTAVVESIRTHGLLGQKFLPFPEGMLKEQFYSGMTDELRAQAKKLLMFFDLKHAWLPTAPTGYNMNTEAQIMDGLKKGVVRVSVDGSQYADKDANGYIKGIAMAGEGKGYIYNHSVAKIGGKLNEYNDIHDHYQNQFPKFVWNYPYGNSKLLYVKKNFPKMVKELGKPAVYGFLPSLGKFAAFSDGVVAGGDVFKAFFGGYQGIQTVDKIPTDLISNIKITTII